MSMLDELRAVLDSLSPEQRATLAELLGAGRVVDTAAPLQRLEGLAQHLRDEVAHFHI